MRTMTDEQIEQALFLTMEGEVIKSLLAGNDTQCFTTAQYEQAKDNWIAKVAGATRQAVGVPKPPSELSRSQLRASSLVVEAHPDVWTLKTLMGK